MNIEPVSVRMLIKTVSRPIPANAPRQAESAALSSDFSELAGEEDVRPRQLRDLSDDELQNRLAETRQELFNLRFQSATGALENSARLRLAKREIARILTIKNERESAMERTT